VKQTLSFPRLINDWSVSNDQNTLLVASDTMIFCFRKKSKEDNYLLLWDEGDSLVCDGAICEGVKGLSDNNMKVFRLKGAHVTDTHSKAGGDPSQAPIVSILSAAEISKIEQELENIKHVQAMYMQQIIEYEQKQAILENKLSGHYRHLSEVHLRHSNEKTEFSITLSQ